MERLDKPKDSLMRKLPMRTAAIVLATTMLAGCQVFDTEANQSYSSTGHWQTPATFTTANIRMITQRNNPVTGRPTICTEPVPDVATAQAIQAAGNLSAGNGAATGSVGGSLAAAETVAELNGRTAALLALRDSMFRTCEAYNNGSLGESAYALVVSRYSQLMAVMFGAQDISSSKASAVALAVASAAVSQSQPAQNQDKGGSTDTDKPTPTPKPTKPTDRKVGDATALPVHLASYEPGRISAPVLKVTAHSISAGGSNTGGGSGSGSGSSNAGGKSSGSGQTGSSDDMDAQTIGSLVDDYLHLGVVGPLFVACMNESDKTRVHVGPLPDDNPWLAKICGQIDSPEALMTMIREEHELALSSTTATAAPAKSAVHAGDPAVAAVQTALRKQTCPGCDPGSADGIAGLHTVAAVQAYQKAAGLDVNGNPADPATLQRLGVPHGAEPADAAGSHHAT